MTLKESEIQKTVIVGKRNSKNTAKKSINEIYQPAPLMNINRMSLRYHGEKCHSTLKENGHKKRILSQLNFGMVVSSID